MMAMLFARSREFSLEILPWQWVLRSDSTRPRDMASSNRRTAALTSSCTSLPSRRPATTNLAEGARVQLRAESRTF